MIDCSDVRWHWESDSKPVSFSQLNFGTKKCGAKSCRKCGAFYLHLNECPAKHAACNFCKITSDFARICEKKFKTKHNQTSQNTVHKDNESHAISLALRMILAMCFQSVKRPLAITHLQISKYKTLIFRWWLTVSQHWWRKTFHELSLHKTALKPCDKKLQGYGGTVILVLGHFCDVGILLSAYKSTFVVVKYDHRNLLRSQTAKTYSLSHLSHSHVITGSDKLVKYLVLQHGIGKLNDRYTSASIAIDGYFFQNICASELFQNTISQAINGIPSVKILLMTLLC